MRPCSASIGGPTFNESFVVNRASPRSDIAGEEIVTSSQDSAMTEPFYTSRTQVRRIQGTHRRARLADGTEVDFGVHGPIKEHYRLDNEKDLPLPVDYIVAATAG